MQHGEETKTAQRESCKMFRFDRLSTWGTCHRSKDLDSLIGFKGVTVGVRQRFGLAALIRMIQGSALGQRDSTLICSIQGRSPIQRIAALNQEAILKTVQEGGVRTATRSFMTAVSNNVCSHSKDGVGTAALKLLELPC